MRRLHEVVEVATRIIETETISWNAAIEKAKTIVGEENDKR